MRMIDADLIKYEPMLSPKGNGQYEGVSVAYKSQIDDLPTIEERKTGKWIDTTQGDHYKCSCCGTRAAFWFNEENSSGWERDMSEWLSDYCPNCGADMRGDENG